MTTYSNGSYGAYDPYGQDYLALQAAQTLLPLPHQPARHHQYYPQDSLYQYPQYHQQQQHQQQSTYHQSVLTESNEQLKEARAHLASLFSSAAVLPSINHAANALQQQQLQLQQQQAQAQIYAQNAYYAEPRLLQAEQYRPQARHELQHQHSRSRIQADDQEYADQCRRDWHPSWVRNHEQDPSSLQPAFRQYPQQSQATSTDWHMSHAAVPSQRSAYATAHANAQQQQLSETYYSAGHHLDAQATWPAYAQELTYGFPQTYQDVKAMDHSAHQVASSDSYLDYDDHPSFAKPPHRTSSLPRPVADNKHSERTTAQKDAFADIQVIAPDASAIPAPPSLDKSAYPLATLATELVWESFLSAATANSGRSSESQSPAELKSSHNTSRSVEQSQRLQASHPVSTPHQRRANTKSISPYVNRHHRSRSGSAGAEAPVGFGAIGGERRPRLSDGSPSSEISSPASSSPGTPSLDGPVGWIQMNESQSRFGIGLTEEEYYPSYAPKHLGVPVIQPLPRSSSLSNNFNHPSRPQGFSPAPPTALYDQVRKLLSATLISQQVLLLAMYFVKKIPYTSPLYPPATSQSALQSTSAPFKLLLAALVAANKHLDDNSFRNCTFATVSKISLPEVNALEYSLLSGLNFDTNLSDAEWLFWLQEMEQRSAALGEDGQCVTQTVLFGLIRGVHAQQYEQSLARQEQRHAVSLSACLQPVAFNRIAAHSRKHSIDVPLTPFTPRSESSFSGGFDLDTAGPLETENRPRYASLAFGSSMIAA